MAREVVKSTAGALTALLEKCKPQIAAALPKHLTPERVMRMATTVFSRTPGLQKCDLTSIIGCVIQASELGLELSGPLGEAYMVPRWNKHSGQDEATFQVGYRGYFQLGFRSGKVLKCPMRTVYAGDEFGIEYGTQDRIRHRPNLGPDQGAPIGYYCAVFLVGGQVEFEFMTTAQIEEHKRKFVQKDREGRIPASSPWNTNPEPMAWKTPARRVFKRLPLSVEIQKAVTYDEYEEQGHMHLRPQLGLTKADVVGAKLTGNDEAASEPERGQEGGEGKPATKRQLGTIRGHLTRLGLAEGENWDGVPLDELTAEEADSLLHTLTQRPTPPSDPPGVGDPANDPDPFTEGQ